ncbi:hypothetical protein FO519_008286 [Halicephalobus sp. NKZ332]|nr:hypothetical protein FO519_008286 [Halicephalobus sp. NKZ332]
MEASSSSSSELPGRIRKRRYSTARIQPTRIKKVMQSDEEIGRMIASVPVAIGSVMEHFAEKLLESAATAMHYSTSKTLSPQHLYVAITQNQHFSFLSPLIKNAGTMPMMPNQAVKHSEFFGSSASASLPTISEEPNHPISTNLSCSEEGMTGKRKRGRPKKDSTQNSQNIPTKDSSINGLVDRDPDEDARLMPPPSFFPNRKFPGSLPISSSVVSTQSKTDSQPQQQTDAISA